MAFVHFTQKSVDSTNVKYEKYIYKLSDSEWSVTVPMSLAGGGSINIGTHDTKAKALEQTKNYFKIVLLESTDESELAAEPARGAAASAGEGDAIDADMRDEISTDIRERQSARQECSSELLILQDKNEELTNEVELLHRAVLIENMIVGELKRIYNISNETIAEIMSNSTITE